MGLSYTSNKNVILCDSLCFFFLYIKEIVAERATKYLAELGVLDTVSMHCIAIIVIAGKHFSNIFQILTCLIL